MLWAIPLLAAALPQSVAQATSDGAATVQASDPNGLVGEISAALARRILDGQRGSGLLGEHEALVNAIAHRLAGEVKVPQAMVYDLAEEIGRKQMARRAGVRAVLRNTGLIVAITLVLIAVHWVVQRIRRGPGPPREPRDRRLQRYLATDPRALLVFAPVASVAQAEEIGHALVSDRLAARVTIAGGIRRLQPGGAEESEREAIALIHSTRPRLKKISRLLSLAYGYRVRDVKPYPVHWAPRSYTRWIEQATRSGPWWRRVWRYLWN
jgi:uncharacterized protein involved in tolerance to divalent cations